VQVFWRIYSYRFKVLKPVYRLRQRFLSSKWTDEGQGRGDAFGQKVCEEIINFFEWPEIWALRWRHRKMMRELAEISRELDEVKRKYGLT